MLKACLQHDAFPMFYSEILGFSFYKLLGGRKPPPKNPLLKGKASAFPMFYSVSFCYCRGVITLFRHIKFQ